MKKDIKADLVYYATFNCFENTLNYLLELEPDASNTNLRNGIYIEDYQLITRSLMIATV